MTERWRQRLRDLDAEGPSEEVFARAKEGPTIPDASLATPSTTTRIATGIAAFLVFGLAISVFVVPILRMSDPAPQIAGSMGLQPLWPYSTLEEAAADQERIDESGADDPALHPDAVVERFAHEVMGWDEIAWITHPDPQSIVGLVCAAPPSPGATGPVTPAPCTPSTPALLGTASPPPSAGELVFEIARYGGTISSRAESQTMVVVYQPLGIGPDDVWAVQLVKTSFIGISARPGDVLSDGQRVGALGGPPGMNGSLHLRVDGACSSHSSVQFVPYERALDRAAGAELDVDLDRDSSCAGQATGRVFALAVDADLEEQALLKFDPFEDDGPPLLGLMAVPVIVDFDTPPPVGSSTSTLPPDTSPDPPTPPPSTYTDETGWTVAIPEGWTWEGIDHQDRVSSRGVYLMSGRTTVIPGDHSPMQGVVPDSGESVVFIWTEEGGPAQLPADDEWPPPTFMDLEEVPEGYGASFRANGRHYSILVKLGGNIMTIGENPIELILSSITFPGWEPGETRDGFTALWELEDSVTWMNLDGEMYLAFGPDPHQIYGPIPTCGEGQNMTEDDQGNAILECPDGSTIGYDRHGLPFDTNPPSNRVPCELNPVIRAWDGTLLAVLDSKVISVA